MINSNQSIVNSNWSFTASLECWAKVRSHTRSDFLIRKLVDQREVINDHEYSNRKQFKSTCIVCSIVLVNVCVNKIIRLNHL